MSGETETAIPLLEVLDVLVQRADRLPDALWDAQVKHRPQEVWEPPVAPLEHQIRTHSAARQVLASVSVEHPGLLALRLNLPVVPQVAVVVSEAHRLQARLEPQNLPAQALVSVLASVMHPQKKVRPSRHRLVQWVVAVAWQQHRFREQRPVQHRRPSEPVLALALGLRKTLAVLNRLLERQALASTLEPHRQVQVRMP